MTAFLNEDFLNEDALTRYRREHDEQQAEFARQRVAEHVQQSKVPTMDADTQKKWDEWCCGHIEKAWEHHHMNVVAQALGITRKEIRDDVATLRREIAAVRDAPAPLIAPPDRRLASALQKVGEELQGLKEGVEATRGDAAERVKRSDLRVLRQRLENRIAELEERNETAGANPENIRKHADELVASAPDIIFANAPPGCGTLAPSDPHRAHIVCCRP
jgi:hypothetical protein